MRDLYGNPLASVIVDASGPNNDCGPGAVGTTDSAGHFSVLIESTVVAGTPGAASAAGYTKTTNILTVADAQNGNDFALPFAIVATVSPAWVRPGETVTVTARTLAPYPPAPGYVCGSGADGQGQLGNGTTTTSVSSATPVVGVGGVGSLSGIGAVAAGNDAAYGLRGDGSVVAWGGNGWGQLGNGTTTDSSTPVMVQGVGGTGTLSGVTALAAGNGAAYGLRSDGTVVAWGNNQHGQIGSGSTTNSISTPVVVAGVGGIGTLTGVKQVAAGNGFAVAVRTDGTVVAWGTNAHGELGNGTTVDSNVPVAVVGVGGTGTLGGIVQVAAGSHTLGLRSDGTVLAWGFNNHGQLGNGTVSNSPTPVAVQGVGGGGALGGIAQVAAGNGHSLALRSDGSVVAWGQNDWGELGNGTTVATSAPVNVVAVGGVGNLGGVQRLAIGSYHSFATLADQTVLGWGMDNGALSQGPHTAMQSLTPIAVRDSTGGPALTEASAVAGGNDYTVILRAAPTCLAGQRSTKLVVENPDHSLVPVSPGGSDASGFTPWTATITTPAGASDGTTTLTLCAVEHNWAGTCENATGPPTRVTPLTAAGYGVDGTPPTVAAQSPTPNHNTTNRSSPIVASASDAMSGVDASTETLSLDGSVVATGTLSYLPPSPLSLGLHIVTASVSDRSSPPNTATSTWQFDVVAFSATAGSAVLAQPAPQVAFKPNPPTQPTVDHVTFTSVRVALSPLQGIFSSSVSSGTGTLAVTIPLSTLSATFSNGVTTSAPQPVSVSPQVLAETFAVLAASSNSIALTVPPQTVDVGPITVPVPPPYNVSGGTATLSMKDEPTSAALPVVDPLPLGLSCSASGSCEVIGTVTCQLSSTSQAQACGGTSAQAYVKVRGGGGTQTYLVAGPYAPILGDLDSTKGPPAYDPLNPSGSYNNQPTCGPTETCTNLLSTSPGADPEQQAFWNPGSSLFSAFGHVRYYETSGSQLAKPLIGVWIQSNAHPGTAPCVAGVPTRAVAKLVGFGTSVQEVAGSWTPTGQLAATTGAPLDAFGQQTVVLKTADSARLQAYVVGGPANLSAVIDSNGQLLGQFAASAGSAYQPDGTVTPASNSSLNAWTPNAVAATASDHELFAGAEYSASSLSAPYSFQTTMFFDFTYDNGSC